MITALFCCFLAAFAYFCHTLIKRKSTGTKTLLYADITQCEELLSGQGLISSGSSYIVNEKLLESRSIPNKRLIEAFGINNAFTTADKPYYELFRKQSTRLLRRAESNWDGLRDTARQLVQHGLRQTIGNKTSGIFLVPFVQILVLKMSIKLFFETPISDLDDAVILHIAEKINKLWISSKCTPGVDRSTFQVDRTSLFENLQRVFPDFSSISSDFPATDPGFSITNPRQSNPLNVILPAYETLWRVVLRCFLEIEFRSKNLLEDREDWRRALLEYLDSPSRSSGAFEASSIRNVSAIAIVKEALRLYPPTRRIHRQLPEGLVAVDVESLHRGESWGADVLCFNPERWTSDHANFAYLPFGCRPLACPAKDVFGPTMIGLLVAAMIEGFQKEKEETEVWEVQEGAENIGGNNPLSSERDAFSSLRVDRIQKLR